MTAMHERIEIARHDLTDEAYAEWCERLVLDGVEPRTEDPVLRRLNWAVRFAWLAVALALLSVAASIVGAVT